MVLESESFRGSRWTLKISFLLSISGRLISILLSNLPVRTRASSKISFLFVAAKTTISESVPKPSSSTSS